MKTEYQGFIVLFRQDRKACSLNSFQSNNLPGKILPIFISANLYTHCTLLELIQFCTMRFETYPYISICEFAFLIFQATRLSHVFHIFVSLPKKVIFAGHIFQINPTSPLLLSICCWRVRYCFIILSVFVQFVEYSEEPAFNAQQWRNWGRCSTKITIMPNIDYYVWYEKRASFLMWYTVNRTFHDRLRRSG